MNEKNVDLVQKLAKNVRAIGKAVACIFQTVISRGDNR